MKLLSAPDASLINYREPVLGGEYSGGIENLTAFAKGTFASFGADAERDYMSDILQPLVEQYASMTNQNSIDMTQIMDNPTYLQDPTGKRSTGIESTINKLYSLAENNPEYKTYLTEQGFDLNSTDSFYRSAQTKAATNAEETIQEQYRVGEKQSILGKIGAFAGSMIGAASDDLDLASMLIPIGSSWNLTRKIATNSAILAGVELYEYDQVKQWHQRLTGEDYTKQEMLQNIALGSAFGGAIIGATHLPIKEYFKYTENKIKRALTPKERIEGIEALRAAHADNQGYTYKPDPELEMGLDRQTALDVNETNNFFPNDPNNTAHHGNTIQFFRHLLDNDMKALDKGPNAGLNVPEDVKLTEKQYNMAEEVDSKTIQIDEDRFQFKQFKEPVPKNVVYDPVKAGHIIVFEDAKGIRTVVDGHTRLRLAQEANQPISAIILKESSGFTPELVRLSSIVRNALDRTISPKDMKVFKMYPGLEDIIDDMLPTYKDSSELARLSAKGFVAFTRGIVSEDVAKIVARKFKDEAEQIAMFDIINKSGLKNVDNIEKLVMETKDLSSYNMSELSLDLEGLYFTRERNAIINDMVKYLERESAALSKQEPTTINKFRRSENEKLIKLIRSYGDEAGILSNEITNAAKAIRRGEDFDVVSNNTVLNLRQGLSEGAFDGQIYRGDIAASSFISETSRVAKQIASDIKTLDDYRNGAASQSVKNEVKSMRERLVADDADEAILNLRVLTDESGQPKTLQEVLDDYAEVDRHLEYINRCRN